METRTNVLIWGADLIEEDTIRQAEKTGRLPILGGPIALMPDAHVGLGSTVGSVVATKGAIIPSCAGVDLGCGLLGSLTNLTASDLPDNLDKLHSQISRSVPAGVGQGRDLKSSGQSNHRLINRASHWLANHPNHNVAIYGKGHDAALSQLGTLGSGNHFLEVCLDELDRVWLVLHSGSRGIGNRLASVHIKLAKAQEQSLEDKDLAYFLQGTEAFDAYVEDMLWAQAYAYENRVLMAAAALDDLFACVGEGKVLETINSHHNYCELETHNNQQLWITRKGAIRARIGDMGVIPGNMGASTFIVRGLGNPDSYNSASHGAGRKMSRSRAKRELTEESLKTAMVGRSWNNNTKALLDEHPEAYKDVAAVMAAQADLVEVVHVLKQVLNYKGV